MTFCTQCGHKNVADSRFCEECGTPLKSAAQAHVPAAPASAPAPVTAPVEHSAGAAPAATRTGNGRLIKMAAVAVVALIAVGLGLVFLLAPESPSNERFAAAIERSLATKPDSYKARYCLNNFPYNVSPVTVNENNENTRRWLSVLVKAGLYTEPELVEEAGLFFTTRKLSYTKTEAGNKATQGNSLCIAEGVSVAQVNSFSPPEKLGEQELSRANVTFKLRNPMPWVTAEETRTLAPEIKAEFSDSTLLLLKEGKWQVASESDLQMLQAQARNQNQAKREQGASVGASGGGGFFASLGQLFSFGASNPLLGKWKTQLMGVTMVAFEFTPDAMVSKGTKTKVRYEIEQGQVTVYQDGSEQGTIFQVVNQDTLKFDAGGIELELKRVTDANQN